MVANLGLEVRDKPPLHSHNGATDVVVAGLSKITVCSL